MRSNSYRVYAAIPRLNIPIEVWHEYKTNLFGVFKVTKLMHSELFQADHSGRDV
jgi:hypothetical protein